MTAPPATFWVHVQAGARRSGLAGMHGDAVKVRVAAPREGGRANEELRRLLAAELGVPPSSVEIVSGHTSRRKRIRVLGAPPGRLAALGGGRA